MKASNAAKLASDSLFQAATDLDDLIKSAEAEGDHALAYQLEKELEKLRETNNFLERIRIAYELVGRL